MIHSFRVFLALAAISFTGLFPAHAQTPVADYQVQGTLNSSVASGIGPLVPIGGITTASYVSTTVNGNPQQVLSIATSTSSTFFLSGVQV